VQLRCSCGAVAVQLRCSCGAVAVQLRCSCGVVAVQLRYNSDDKAIKSIQVFNGIQCYEPSGDEDEPNEP
jgi:hypothetical protein